MPQENIDERAMAEITKMILSNLDPVEQDVVRLHFGLSDGEEMPVSTVAEHLQLSVTAVREAIVRALRKLRHPSSVRSLDAFRNAKEVLETIQTEDLSYDEAKKLVEEELPAMFPTVEKWAKSNQGLIAILVLVITLMGFLRNCATGTGEKSSTVIVNQQVTIQQMHETPPASQGTPEKRSDSHPNPHSKASKTK